LGKHESKTMLPDDPGIEAAAKVVFEAGRFHRWWELDKPYDQLDRIGKEEFDGIVRKALKAADAARQVAHSDIPKGGQKSEIILCLLPLIESGRAGVRADAAAADAIAACARFNSWVLEQKMARQGSLDGFLQLLELADSLQRVAAKLN
jgi:hypothetical protein